MRVEWSVASSVKAYLRIRRNAGESAIRQAISRSLSIPYKYPISSVRKYVTGGNDGRPILSEKSPRQRDSTKRIKLTASRNLLTCT